MIVNYSELDSSVQGTISASICERMQAEIGRSVQASILTRALIMFEVSVEIRGEDAYALRRDASLESAVKYLSGKLT